MPCMGSKRDGKLPRLRRGPRGTPGMPAWFQIPQRVVITPDGARLHPRAPRKASHLGSERVCCVGVRMAVKVCAGGAARDTRSLSLPWVSSDGLQIQCNGKGRGRQSGL